ncbi:TIGR04283 family arsenosugar biosynthesis glycosyltransferase [Brevundimonas sp.]|uniref:TIGR04283 family arsenosugar biosynthesis glycosyltransferase n=1 Tax=Brevundimonas sp. TaxID=1871086 RepID=UPI00356B5D32
MTMPRPPLGSLDVIIPVLNGAERLAGTLEGLPPANAVIVVDGGSTDESAAIAAAHGARVIRSAPGRGLQLAVGAAASTAPWRLFLHADTRPDAAAWTALAAHIASPDASRWAAVFRFQLDDRAWQARVLEVGVRLRGAFLALPYGDQGLLIHRDLYDAVGGFARLPLMEDVDLVRRLGRRRLRVLDGYAVTSAERWRRRGWVGQSVLNLSCLVLYLVGVAPARIARLYGR